jgi:hypothetical protein
MQWQSQGIRNRDLGISVSLEMATLERGELGCQARSTFDRPETLVWYLA